MKASEYNVPVVLFIMEYKVVLTFESELKMKSSKSVTIQKKATARVVQYFAVVLFIMLQKAVIS